MKKSNSWPNGIPRKAYRSASEARLSRFLDRNPDKKIVDVAELLAKLPRREMKK